MARTLTAILVVLFAATTSGRAHASGFVDPTLRFRTLPTEHFIIYFHQGEDALARRLAAIAEETWRAVQRPLGVTPPARTHVVLVDQTELANGWATPLPYNTIMITAAWPLGSEFIGSTDDWLRLVFTHEFTHIVHLDRSEGWARGVRRVFGRMQIAFPNVFLPRWQIEGLATYQESVATGYGRLHAGDFQAVIREAARSHALQPLDRINGGLTDWPNGDGEYAYGLDFHRYLAERFGADTLGRLAEATARRLPYTASTAFKRVYSESLGGLWRDYQASLARVTGDAGSDNLVSSQTRLTYHHYDVSGPRFDREACVPCPLEVVYSLRSPDGFPSLYRVALDGSAPRPITRRFLGSTTAIGADALYFDQHDLRRNTGLYSDLYAWSRATGRVRQMTSEARLMDPDLSPDGRTLAAVQERRGQRDLVLVRLKPDPTDVSRRSTAGLAEIAERFPPMCSGCSTVSDSVVSGFSPTVPVASGFSRTPEIEILLSEPETQFNTPRWSPDGRSIAVERHRLGSLSEIVVVDVATRSVHALTADVRGRSVTPAWRPDGRAIVAAIAPEDQPFNLYEFPLDGGPARPLTTTSGGAKWPDISPDGKTIVFVGYTVTGFDLFTIPYPSRSEVGLVSGCSQGEVGLVASRYKQPARALQGDAVSLSSLRPTGPPGQIVATDPRVRRYSPWSTLRPTSWTPVIEIDRTQTRIGAAIGGFDVLGYHGYAASATWLAAHPSGALTPNAATPDWSISYAYARWRPTLWAAASNSTSFFSGPETEGGTPTDATLRERQIEGGVIFPVRHVRTSHLARFSILTAIDDFTFPRRTVSRNRTALRAGWASTSAHTYGYSISPEGGVTAGTTAESVPEALGSSASATAFTADVRTYLPGAARHHVLALRAAGGASNGDRDVRRTFHLGGAAPGGSVIDFGRSAISLLRGFGPDTFAGSRVALVNADYRFPIARPQRGYGTWPLFVHTIHAAVFVDAGHAWTRTFHSSAIKTSSGAELSARIVAGYFFPFIVTVGGAWGHDGARTVRDRATAYVRVGHAF